MFKKNSKYEVLTPSGWQNFSGVMCKGPRKTATITLSSGKSACATPDHYFFSRGQPIPLKDFEIGMPIDIVDGTEEIVSIVMGGDETDVFDLVEVDNGHVFCVNNGILSKNCDEFAFIPPNKQKDFWSSVRPVLATGGSCIVTSTPRNDEDQFAQIWKSAIDTTDQYGNPKEDGLGKNGWKAVESPWTDMIGYDPNRTEEWAEQERYSLGNARFLQEYECKFYSDEETLVHPMTLKRISDHTKDPLFYVGTTRWYAEPKANKGYLVTLDPATGTGGDSAAIQVFQLGPEIVQVAEWSHDNTPPRGQVKTLLQTLLFIDQTLRDMDDQMGEPEIYWSFENNGVGAAIGQVVEHTGEERFPGYLVSDKRKAGSKNVQKGMFTSRGKAAECARLKSLIESDRMKINSRNLVRELKFFIATDNTFKAKQGEHDDLVSATLLVVRLLDLVMRWEDKSTNDLREHIDDEEIMQIDPMPIVV